MSAEVEAGAPNIVVPQFSSELIDVALVAAEAGPDTFRREQLAMMALHNNPLRAFFEAKIAAFGSRGESELCGTWMGNYVIGHSALRSAVSLDIPLPARDLASLHSFAQFAHRSPAMLDSSIEEDYGAHPNMTGLLKTLSECNDGNTDGARFILGVYGLWANPARPPRIHPPASGLPPVNRSKAQKRQEEAYNTGRRFAPR